MPTPGRFSRSVARRQARSYFERPGDEASAERFCNDIALLADRPPLADIRDELRDQALLTLAVKLQQRAAMETRPGNAVSVLLGRAGVWPGPAVHDAEHAFRAAVHKPAKEIAPRPFAHVRLGVGRVTAVGYAPMTGDVFVGFLSGDVACFRPVSGRVFPVKSGDGLHVHSLATSSHGEVLCVLQTSGPEWDVEGRKNIRFRCYTRMPDGSYNPFDHSEETFFWVWRG